jgi:hypothetical protein
MKIQDYLKRGYPVFPCSRDKTPLVKGSWRLYEDEKKAKIEDFKTNHVALIMGTKFNLECIDLDAKYDPEGHVCSNYLAEVLALHPDILVNETQSGGWHIIYKCAEVKNSTHLAEISVGDNGYNYSTTDKSKAKEVKATIETRGVGSYILIPPSPGYKKINGKIIELTPEQRDDLWELARSYNLVTNHLNYVPSAKMSTDENRPGDDYNSKNSIYNLMTAHGWTQVDKRGEEIGMKRSGGTGKSASINEAMNSVFIFSSNCHPLEQHRSYRPFDFYTAITHGGNYSEAAKQLAKEGYGEKSIDRTEVRKLITQFKKAGGLTNESIKVELEERGFTVAANEVEKFLNTEKREWFWTLNEKGKVVISETQYHDWVERNVNFYKIKHNEVITYVIIENNIVRHLEDDFGEIMMRVAKAILDIGEEWIDDIHVNNLLDSISRKNAVLFSPGVLGNKQLKEVEFIKDEKDQKYFAAGDKLITVTRSDVKVEDLANSGKYVWESEYHATPFTALQHSDVKESDAYKYMEAVAGDRVNQFIAAFGYLLHDYFDPIRPISIFLTEKRFREGESNGGTGKGIFYELVKQAKEVFYIDGKNDSKTDSFRFDGFKKGTKLVFFDDVLKNFDFSNMYNFITSGVTINQKNQRKEREKGLKLFFSGNFGVNHDGSRSTDRRLRVLEFEDTLALEEHALYKLIGRRMILEWDDSERNRFLNFCIYAVQLYFKDGLVKIDNKNILSQALANRYGEAFRGWFVDWYEHERSEGFKNTHISSDLYNNYKHATGETDRDFSIKRFGHAFRFGVEKLYGECKVKKEIRSFNGMNSQVYILIPEVEIVEKPKTEVYDPFDLLNEF